MKKLWLIIPLTLLALSYPHQITASDQPPSELVRPPRVEMAFLEVDVAAADKLYAEWLDSKRNKIAGYNACSCVSYAKFKSGINVGSIGKAMNHPINANSPRLGAIIVFSISSGTYRNTGHLGVVVSIDGNFISVSESNYIPCKVSTRKIPITDPSIRGYYVLE